MFRKNIKAIHCGQIKSGLVGYIFKILFQKPYFIYVYGLEIASPLKRGLVYKKKFYSFLLRNSTIVISISNNTKLLALKYGIPPEKIIVVHLGVDLERFNPNSKSSYLKKKYGFESKKIILSVGHLIERKGFDYILKSLPAVLEKVKNAFYVIVGEGEDKSRLKSLVKKFNIEDYVLFAGKINDKDLPYYYAMSDIFVMPSRELQSGDIEGFGIVFLEANACRKPVIGGHSGGIVDAVIDGETGILVNPTDPDEISKAIIKLLTDREYAKRLGENGRKRVEREHNWKNIAKTVERIVEDVLVK